MKEDCKGDQMTSLFVGRHHHTEDCKHDVAVAYMSVTRYIKFLLIRC